VNEAFIRFIPRSATRFLNIILRIVVLFNPGKVFPPMAVILISLGVGLTIAWTNHCTAGFIKGGDENGLYDYSETSRKTKFIYPSGLMRLNSPIVNRLRNGLLKNMVINPLWMDDRYCIPLATDYLSAYSTKKN